MPSTVTPSTTQLTSLITYRSGSGDRGHEPEEREGTFAFAVLKMDVELSEKLEKELVNIVRVKIGPVATPKELCFIKRIYPQSKTTQLWGKFPEP